MVRWLAPILALFLTSWVQAQEAGIDFFERKIRPVLAEHCYKCHSTAGKKMKGKLLLDSRDGIRKGGESGPAVVPGKPGESWLLKAVRFQDDLKMPPDGKLPAQVIADLEAWIALGAPDPRDRPAAVPVASTWEEVLRTRRTWWSLQPVVKPAIPSVKNAGWSEHPVDRFLLAKLEEKKLTPAPAADPRTLFRRLHLVLTGLPPAPADMESFLGKHQENSQAALDHAVDQLQRSPHFGERWARHWLDVVRFSETHGNEWNYDVHHAWRYRDHLIRAFNQDVPFDQLVREHVAGDLLAKPRWNTKEKFNESVIGTAFYRFGEVNHDDCIDLPSIPYDLVDNQIDTLSKAFQGMTVACARCHDHKIDAVSMKDYYGLLGILRSARQVAHTIDAPDVNAATLEKMRQVKNDIQGALTKVWLEDARQVGDYLLAAQAQIDKKGNAPDLAKGLDRQRLDLLIKTLTAKSGGLEDPWEPWRVLAQAKDQDGKSAAELRTRYKTEQAHREKTAAKYITWADFSQGHADWQVGGQGLRQGFQPESDFILHDGGDQLVRAVVPAGMFTHALSPRLNGTIRSPILPAGKKYISFQVMGQGQSAVRLVSNHCQLNYRNYKALTRDRLHWITLPIPENPAALRMYAELMTKVDNPKFPDQLGTLGADTTNQRVPYEKAMADPRSFFGVTRVVLHDDPQPPPGELLGAVLFEGKGSPKNLGELTLMYGKLAQEAVRFWAKGDKERQPWLDALLRTGLLCNRLDLSPRLEKLAKEFRQLEASLSLPRVVPGMADFGPGAEQPIFVRGDCTKPGELAPRRYLEVLSRPSEPGIQQGSGRLELALHLASPTNPLTARVFVNRVWHHLFGAGLVRSVDDFGRVGDLPSHPELLDYLAARFVEEEWSVKRLIRTLVLTRAFQQANRPNPLAKEVDPENRLLHHFPARRLEAEAIRDSILAASGKLDRTLFGPSVHPYREQEIADRRLFAGPLDGGGRRSIYLRNNLMETPRFLGAFNLPGGKVTQGRRDVTNVPAQALALLNDPFVHQQADVWAARLVQRVDSSAAARIDHMFQNALGRPPTPEERQRFEKAVDQLADLHGVIAGQVLSSQPLWKDLAQALFNLKEFIYVP